MANTDKKIILILGGARSGKSTYAQQLASSKGEKILFCATAEPLDDDMRHRIEQHKKSRPSGWQTLEVSRDLGRVLGNLISRYDAVIIDCITLLVSNCLQDAADPVQAEKTVFEEIRALIKFIERRNSCYILVSNEVGDGLVPDNVLGRTYRDMLGKTNQLLAKAADEVYLMVAGIPLKVR
ncbi:MAG: bifunctional adenosylcobinamide kinase/adenosylcobinamide-phosphate guanylyltransferase [Dehalococcoidia bacterium]|jgi:adenosylcobinamide kinase/adenosylcobinamide-phosphate guanylyltransferase